MVTAQHSVDFAGFGFGERLLRTDSRDHESSGHGDTLARAFEDIEKSVVHILGPKSDSLDPSPDEATVLCLVRDGLPYVEPFLDHYRKLGVRNFVFLDNGSTDGTVEALQSLSSVGSGGREDISVYQTHLPYGEYRHELKQYMIRAFGVRDRWAFVVDIDEFFDYPRSSIVSLDRFLERLTSLGYTAVVSQMLDMFPQDDIAPQENPDGSSDGSPNGQENPAPASPAPLRERHRFYDLSDVQVADYATHPWVRDNEISNPYVMALRGGIRKATFGTNVTLTKHALMLLDGTIRPMVDSAHWVNGASVADVSCVLYHYKFLDGFHDFVRRAALEGSYADGSAEYKRYMEVLEQEPTLRLTGRSTLELHSTDDLVAGGFLVTSERYDAYADEMERVEIQRLAREEPERLVEWHLDLRAELSVGAREIRRVRRKSHEDTLSLLNRSERLQSQLTDITTSRSWRLIQALGSFFGRGRKS